MKKISFIAIAAAVLFSCTQKPAPVSSRFEVLPDWSQKEGGYAYTLPIEEVHSARYLVFDGVLPHGELQVNGRAVKAGVADVAPSVVPLNGWLRFGKNKLKVDGEAFPGPVRLLEGRRIYFSPEFYGVRRIHTFCVDVQDSTATLYVKAWLRNADAVNRKTKVHLTLKDADGLVVAEDVQTVYIRSHRTERYAFTLRLGDIHRWNGKEDPYLYTLEAATGSDKISVDVGIRTVERGAEGLLLNGRPVQEEEGRLIELDQYPLTHAQLSEYDREGILVRIVAPKEDAEARMPALVMEFSSHPCIAEWVTQDAALYQQIRIRDPYRPLQYRP